MFFKYRSYICHNSEPREHQIEAALLQQLHSVIADSIKDIYKSTHAAYGCDRITSINERVTVIIEEEKKGTVRADAIGGAKYFELKFSLCNVGANVDYVELYLKNDSPLAQYYLDGYKITPKD